MLQLDTGDHTTGVMNTADEFFQWALATSGISAGWATPNEHRRQGWDVLLHSGGAKSPGVRVAVPRLQEATEAWVAIRRVVCGHAELFAFRINDTWRLVPRTRLARWLMQGMRPDGAPPRRVDSTDNARGITERCITTCSDGVLVRVHTTEEILPLEVSVDVKTAIAMLLHLRDRGHLA